MKRFFFFGRLGVAAAFSLSLLCAQTADVVRPPAVPLVAHDPYFSIWSMADHLNDQETRHWTGKPNRLNAVLRVDGKPYQVMGHEGRGEALIPPLPQTGLEVLPTRTLYQFSGAGVDLHLMFLTPALPYDLDVLSRPLTYVEWRIASSDGGNHQVELYFDAASDLVVNTPGEAVVSSRYLLDGETVLRMGSREQPVLAKRGDDLRIDWGYLYLMADKPDGATYSVARHRAALAAFEADGRLPRSDDFSGETVRRGSPESLAVSVNFGTVGSQPVSRYLMLAYDDIYAIEYFERKTRAWWRRNGAGPDDLLRAGRAEHDELLKKAYTFDHELMADLRKAGGEKYARLAALAYRQTLAAHKLVADADGTALYFPKENFSNGCIGTVDVIYPSSPFTMLFNPLLLKAQLEPVLAYASMPRWRWPFAPHDLGTYPQANGQVYGGGERTEENQMPVEESGNMLIMVAALAHIEGSAAFAEKYWSELTKWAEYLRVKGLDPENQLSTDDFAGHLAHNANLSIKAILALGSYGQLCELTGRKSEAVRYHDIAADFAKKWQELAREGDHYRLAFDRPGTWSQKYNLVWDRLLGLNLFSPDIVRTEVNYYEARQNKYGLPLDNRRDYTKLDWLVWTATLAGNRASFEQFVAPAFRWMNETPARVPLTDWYDTVTGKQEGFQARSVVGGIFIPMLSDAALWKKYSTLPLQRGAADRDRKGNNHGDPR
jgi:hypothetical protein